MPISSKPCRVLADCFLNSGQTCAALTRMLVPREHLAQAEALAADACAQQVLGDPMAEGTTLGPLVSGTQRERVRSYIRKGIEEGAKLVCGGEEFPPGSTSATSWRPRSSPT